MSSLRTEQRVPLEGIGERIRPRERKAKPIADVTSTEREKRINGGMPLGYSGRTALRRE
jgi:hypothetical protein